MEYWKRQKPVFFALSVPSIAWLILFFLVPVAIIWVFSFSEKSGIVDLDLTWTLKHYLRAFEPTYLNVFLKSLVIAGAATLICLIFGYPVALAIAFAPQKWKNILLVLVILPFWINVLIRTYALIAVFRKRGFFNFTYEWIWQKANMVLEFLQLGDLNLLGERFMALPILYNNSAVVIGLVYAYLPFMILPLYANLENFNKSYLEASLDLGANQFKAFITVLFPLSLPGVLSGIIIVFVPAMGAFFIADMLGGADSQLIGNVIERQFKSANNWPFGSVLSLLLMYITFGIIAFRSLVISRRKGLSKENNAF